MPRPNSRFVGVPLTSRRIAQDWLGPASGSSNLTAIAALLSIPAYPFWSLCVFALSIIVVYELAKPYDGT